jgi:hypothetical protein
LDCFHGGGVIRLRARGGGQEGLHGGVLDTVPESEVIPDLLEEREGMELISVD